MCAMKYRMNAETLWSSRAAEADSGMRFRSKSYYTFSNILRRRSAGRKRDRRRQTGEGRPEVRAFAAATTRSRRFDHPLGHAKGASDRGGSTWRFRSDVYRPL